MRGDIGVPNVNRVARMFGDVSSLGGASSAYSLIENRAKNRVLGRMAGTSMGLAKSYFGVFGLLAFAQFMGYLKDLTNAANSTEYWVGNMTRYAGWVDRGFVHAWNHLAYPPTYFYRDAVAKATNDVFRSNAFTGYGTGAFSGKASPSKILGARSGREAMWRTRTGIYEGQKFLGDMYGFLSGDAVGRVARREAGRATTSFIWGALINPQNLFLKLATQTQANARRNIKNYPSTSKKTWGLSQAAQSDPLAAEILSSFPKRQRVIYDTGLLWATMAIGPTEHEMISASVNQARSYANKIGKSSDWLDGRMSWNKSSGGGGRTFTLHASMMAD